MDIANDGSGSEKWVLVESRARVKRIGDLSRHMRTQAIEFIMFKGWVCSQLYPRHIPRFANDIDIAVCERDFLVWKQNVGVPGLGNLDIHCEFRKIDSLTWDEHLARSRIVELDGTVVRVPCPEDHLRIVATHWLNDGGVNKERLWDIYYSVQNRPKVFDWSKCLDCVSETRRGWVITTIGLAHKYLGLNIDDLPFRDEALRIPKWVTDTLEREWAIEEPIRPLQTCTRDPKLFVRQLKRRIPPNPIQATIQMEAPIDDRGRTMIQLRNVIRRAGPSVERISSVLRGRMRRNSK